MRYFSLKTWGSDRMCLSSLVGSLLDYSALVYNSAQPFLKLLDPVHRLGLRLAMEPSEHYPCLDCMPNLIRFPYLNGDCTWAWYMLPGSWLILNVEYTMLFGSLNLTAFLSTSRGRYGHWVWVLKVTRRFLALTLMNFNFYKTLRALRPGTCWPCPVSSYLHSLRSTVSCTHPNY